MGPTLRHREMALSSSSDRTTCIPVLLPSIVMQSVACYLNTPGVLAWTERRGGPSTRTHVWASRNPLLEDVEPSPMLKFKAIAHRLGLSSDIMIRFET